MDVNEGFIPMKIVRNNKKVLAILNVSFFSLDCVVTHNLPKSLSLIMLQNLSFIIGMYAGKNIYNLSDPYKEIASRRLKELAINLKNIYVNTDYDLLLNSELLSKNYRIHLNENNIPSLLEEKYILVPSYDFNGNTKHTSIVQEHVVGSSNYVLSIGSPKKELKFVKQSV